MENYIKMPVSLKTFEIEIYEAKTSVFWVRPTTPACRVLFKTLIQFSKKNETSYVAIHYNLGMTSSYVGYLICAKLDWLGPFLLI